MIITTRAGEPACYLGDDGLLYMRRDVIRDRKLRDGAMRLLSIMAMHPNASHDELAGLMNCTTRTITRDVANLIERGYVKRAEDQRRKAA